MSSVRRLVFAPGEIYHIFNRSVEGRTIFTTKKEYQRALAVISYYQAANLPLRYSHFLELPAEEREKILSREKKQMVVKIIAFCLMPNHFHFLLREEKEKGISHFVSNVCNSYGKYFNTRHSRFGPLFQGAFQAVHIETDEQLIHLSRYIHLNPVSSFLLEVRDLENYPWSSLPEYLGKTKEKICDTSLVLSHFANIQQYKRFVYDQADYGRQLEKIKHLACE